MNNQLLDYKYDDSNLVGINRMIVPFLACGDLSGYDADQSYSLLEVSNNNVDINDDYSYHEPIQRPINPSYASYMQLKGDGLLK